MAVTVQQLLKQEYIPSDKKSPIEKTLPTFDSIKSIVNTHDTFPLHEKNYVYLYFVLEHYALVHHRGLRREEIRNNIASTFNVAWFSPRVSALFRLQDPDKLVFTEIILESLLQKLVVQVGVGPLQKIVTHILTDTLRWDISVILEESKIDLMEMEKYIYLDDTNVGQRVIDLHIMIESLYSFVRNSLGNKASETIFSSSFQYLAGKYLFIPEFKEAVKSLPEGIFGRERLDLLTKEELEYLSKRLQQVDEMKSEFTNIAAHELKTPLVPIIGYSSLMLQNPIKYGLNTKGKEYIRIFSRNALRLQRLVDDISDVSKLEAGEMNFKPLAQKKQIKLLVNLPPESKRPTITADAQRISQVLSNLLKNAIKFTDKGSVRLRVEIQKKQLNIYVTDTGSGLAPKDLKKIFEKFYQAQQVATRKTKGTGLGLSITKHIVEAHGGKIWVTSKGKGKGTTFHVQLPITQNR
jgi:signal transduction histidine kinase